MTSIVWTMAGLLAVLWTGTLGLAVLLLDWARGALGQAGTVSTVAAGGDQLDLPVRLAAWIDPELWASLQQAAQAILQASQSWAPTAAGAAGWLVGATWILWGIGMAMLVALALALHGLIRRRAAPARAAA